ncbi:MAG: FAD-binding protein [Coriobacteriales bacterium]|nr:FAD-binding protein [Coriobacteriales bacterium]
MDTNKKTLQASEEQARRNLSRRDFFKVAAAGTAGVAGVAALGACSTGSGGGESAGSGSAETPAAGGYDVMAEMGSTNRGANPEAVAATTPEEYVLQKGDGALQFDFGNPALGITPADFMLNVPAWLGSEPDVGAPVDTVSCDVLVIGAGNAGSVAALRCQQAGLTTYLAESQTYDEYDEYACDMAMYNAKIFLDKGTPYMDPMIIMNEYLREYRGKCNWKLVKDYATRSGETLDWILENIPQDLIDRYAKTFGYKGNANFNGICDMQYSFIGMTQWRDTEKNINMWPYVIRELHKQLEAEGGMMLWGYQGLKLVHAGDTVSGALFRDIDDAIHQVDAKAVIVCAGDFGGNPDMRLDLSDQMRNLAWSRGMDRTDANSTGGMGRDGSGIRMMLWAGATMEAGPRPAQSVGINGKPAAIVAGGSYPVFGNNGKRFMNESFIKHGSNGYLDMLPADFAMVSVADANWEKWMSYQGYGHETMDTSSDYMLDEVRANYAAGNTSEEGFEVRSFARFGIEYSVQTAAPDLQTLAERAYPGDAATQQAFLAEIEHYNEMCAAGHDDDWGCDPQNMFPILDAPFYYSLGSITDGTPSNGLCQHAAVCTDDEYRVLTGAKAPIEGLYAGGNCCGQRIGIQYVTPTAGNSCGSALTSGFCAADSAIADLS